MVNAVIFDMDGLMFDTEMLAKHAWLQAGIQLGVPIDEAVISQIRGSTPAASEKVFRSAYGDNFDYWKAKSLRNTLVEQYIDQNGVPVKKGLFELLNYLSSHGIKAAVASSSPITTIQKYLHLAGVAQCFQVIIGAEMVQFSKPAPDAFLLAAKALGENRRNCLVLEDSENGLIAAKRAEMQSIWIPDLSVPKQSVLAGVAASLENLSVVCQWLAKENR